VTPLHAQACALDAREFAVRERRFAALAEHATAREESDSGVRLVFPTDSAIAAEAATIAALESVCCPLSFRLDVRRESMELLVVTR
jgi:hypothetical protein